MATGAAGETSRSNVDRLLAVGPCSTDGAGRLACAGRCSSGDGVGRIETPPRPGRARRRGASGSETDGRTYHQKHLRRHRPPLRGGGPNRRERAEPDGPPPRHGTGPCPRLAVPVFPEHDYRPARASARRMRAKRREDDPTMALSIETVRAREAARFDRVARMRRDPRFRRWLANLRAKEAALGQLDFSQPPDFEPPPESD